MRISDWSSDVYSSYLIGGDGFVGLAVADRGSSKHVLFLWLRVDGGSRAAAIARLERVRGDLCGMENGLMVFHRLGPGRRTGCRFGIGRRRRAGGRNDLAARRWDRAARTVDRKSTRLNSRHTFASRMPHTA